MKKIFTLLTLLLCAVSGAWADVKIYSYSVVASQAKDTNFDASGTIGGTFRSNKAAESSADAIKLDGDFAGKYIQINLANSEVLAEGDKIVVTMYQNSTNSPNNGYGVDFYTTTENTPSSVGSLTIPNTSGKTSQNYTLELGGTSELVGKNVFYIGRHTGSTYFEKIQIKRAGKADANFSLVSNNIKTNATGQIRVNNEAGLDGLTMTGLTYDETVISINENGVITPLKAGTSTITFNTAATDDYNAGSANLSITVTQAILVFDGAGVSNQEIRLTLDNINDKDYLSTNQTASNFSDKTWTGYEGKYLDMKTGRTISITVKNVSSFEFYLNGTSGRKYKVKVGDADAVEYTQGSGSGHISSGVIATGTTEQVTIVIEGGSNTLYPVYCKVNPAVSATISGYKWATFVSDKVLDFTNSDVKAYVVTGHSGTAIVKSQVNTVAANTPLLLNADAAGDYDIILAASGTDYSSSNLLKAGTGADVSAEGGKTKYVLADDGGTANFLQIMSSVAVPTGKAYLEFNEVIAAREFSLDGDATAIKNIKVGTEDNIYYDLNGRRVLYPTKGLYIVNGKKVILK